MKCVAVLFCLLAAASASERLVNTYLMPPGAERFRNVLRAVEYSRIVGGEEAEPHSRPFQVGLFLSLPQGRGFCGGSLITPEYVLTAAHCISPDGNVVVSEFEVILGAHNIYDMEGTLRFKTDKYIIHFGWSPLTLQNDIGLIKLPAIVKPTDRIQFANLPPRSAMEEKFVDYPGTASGWGKTSDGNNSIADNLHVVTTPVMTNFLCNIRYLGVIQPSHICTSGRNGMSTCSGDSGGPMTVEFEGKDIQVGLVSFGIAFGCEIGWPAVYTRITSFMDWIGDQTAEPEK